MNEDWKKSWFPFSVHTFPRELSYLLSTFWSPSWFSQSDINSTPSCEDYEKWLWGRYLTKSSVSVASFLFFYETCLTSDNYEFFPFLSFYVCIFLYAHCAQGPKFVRKYSTRPQSPNQQTKHACTKRFFYKSFGPTCLCALHVYKCFFKKCAERSHFRAEFKTLLILFYRYFKYLLKSMYFRLRGIFGFLRLHLLSCNAKATT